MSPPPYPPAERLDLVETLHGHRVADPYRWLEDPDDPRTRAWSAAQDDLATAHLDPLPGRDHLAARLHDLLAAGFVSPPSWRTGRAFFARRTPGQEHAVAFVREPDGTERVLLDPVAIDPSGLTTLDAWVPDLEGARVAYQLSAGGDEHSVLHVLDVTTGEDVEAPIDRCRYSVVAWMPGGEEFVYVRMVDATEVPEGQQAFHRRIRRHRLGTPTSADLLIDGPGLYADHNYYGVGISRDGRWLIVTANVGTARRDSVWLADLHGDGALVRLLTQDDDVQCHAWVDRDGRLYLHTTDGAPLGTIALPGTGSLSGLTVADRDTPAEHGRLWFGWTDLVTPPQVHRFDLATRETALEHTVPGAVTVPDVRTEQREFTSADGTTVRMFVITPAGPPGPRPTLVTGYGGFGISREPAYSASALAWVAAGGGYALVSLRGGGEEGEDWHRAGNRANKRYVFDDLHAAAESLIAAGDTTPAQLSIMGGSNGGLLVGAALVQRPDLYRAVVCSAPLLDMVRYEEFSLGRTWNEEYGTAADPQELGWLLSYSPYHHVTDGIDAPAVLFTVFDSDTRVDPLHARKMCAALQHASGSDRPILLRRETDVGHGARSVSRSVGLAADQLAFLAAHTGLEIHP